MRNDHELECIIDRLNQETQRLSETARMGQLAIDELDHFRTAFGIAPETDLVLEFDRRARGQGAPGIITREEIDQAHRGTVAL